MTEDYTNTDTKMIYTDGDTNTWLKIRVQTNTDNPAEYGYIRNRIVPLVMKRISI